jgi:seryl-tRNA synthetase
VIDINELRTNPRQSIQSLDSRGTGYAEAISDILTLDIDRKKAISKLDTLKATRNQVSKQIGLAKNQGQLDEKETIKLIGSMRTLGSRIARIEKQLSTCEQSILATRLSLPNFPNINSPLGSDESANVVIKTHGTLPTFDFPPKHHWEIASELGIIDFEQGAKISGSKFFVLKGKGALLQRALIAWMLDVHTGVNKYTEIIPPYLVKPESLLGSGNLPKFGDNIYHDSEDNLWLIPTAEVPLTNLHRDEILSGKNLPLFYVAHTPCFRREKAAAGKDTRGIKRVHQFDKVELYKLVTPETSEDELQQLLRNAESICLSLELPYRVIELCTGELSFPASRGYDLEVWAAGDQEWLEVSTCSNCTDFQARRANLRFKRTDNTKPEFLHTLNGSALAIPRVLIAVIENYQQQDGSIRIPHVLQPYTKFDHIG